MVRETRRAHSKYPWSKVPFRGDIVYESVEQLFNIEMPLPAQLTSS